MSCWARWARCGIDPARCRDLEEQLTPLLSAQELDALYARWDRLLAHPPSPSSTPTATSRGRRF